MNPAEISYTELSQWLHDKKEFAFIDIREEEERKESHMGGQWLPLSELGEKLEDLPKGSIVLYCRSGGRSLMATIKLRELLARDNIYSLHGGMLAKP
ncbi:MAG: rhodanese-like domain-containing protein [Chlamydiae bacterium]|nr:rhodanese-like domain-containing protein [Chlamydiota bacterium]